MNPAHQSLTEVQRQVVTRAMEAEDAARRHVVVSLSGAHAYGFPSPDSDVDLKAVHLADSRAVLGLTPPALSRERLEVIDGVEFDFSSNELGGVLTGVLKGNGNYVERFLSRFVWSSGPGFALLVPLIRGALSRELSHHYRGFATAQRRAWEAGGRVSAKKLLYVLRTLLTGTHVLTTGEVETDLQLLAPRYGLDDALALIEQKRRGERAELPGALADAWSERLDTVFLRLEQAREASVLPPGAENRDALEAALVRLRLDAL